ncbi:hypothetical protein BHE74_00008757 [Ensete ventricosum]|nr:hypothetical protein GW17_00002171 [Ensete ventricosum]RWW82755.1 hypothetical protein BHE74_00008757 [Ensete ventricosum]
MLDSSLGVCEWGTHTCPQRGWRGEGSWRHKGGKSAGQHGMVKAMDLTDGDGDGICAGSKHRHRLLVAILMTSLGMCYIYIYVVGFGAVAEESARAGPCQRSPSLALPRGDFILTRRRIGCTLGLTSTDTLGEVTVYGESSGTEIWQKGVARHATLITHYGGSTDSSLGRLHLGC